MAQQTNTVKHVGRYRVDSLVARGGMGEIWRGHDDEHDRPVALKRLLPERQDSPLTRQRFRREAEIAKRLQHPCLVKTDELIEADGSDWMVMEWIDGRCLQELLAHAALNIDSVQEIGRQLAAALAVMHRQGFVHRDLKPANVMVLRKPLATGDRVKLLDFGLAKPIDAKETEQVQDGQLTGEGQIPGTLVWMSPEQAMGYPVELASDLFSLGSLLYAMLAGSSPFGGHSALETLRRLCTVREKPIKVLAPDVPPTLSSLVHRLLEKDPGQRPSAQAVLEELDATLADLKKRSARRCNSGPIQVSAGTRLSSESETLVDSQLAIWAETRVDIRPRYQRALGLSRAGRGRGRGPYRSGLYGFP